MNPELWRSHPLLSAASLLPVVAGVVWMAIAPQLPPFRRRRALLGWLTWAGTRAAFAGLVWGVLAHPGLDMLAYFLPQARHALAGGVPYRDFPSSYAPLFAPLLGLSVGAAGGLGPLLVFLLGDLVAWRALVAMEGEEGEASWAYVAMPAFWYLTVRYAQDEPMSAAFLGLAALALRRDRPAWAGLALAGGFLCTKLVFALPALAVVLASRRRAALVAAGAIPVAVVYGALLLLRAPVLQPLTLEGPSFGIGPTVWRLPVLYLHVDAGPAGWLPFLALLAWGAVRLLARGAPAEDHAMWGYAAFALVSPKFMPMYVILWGPLVAAWASRDPDRRGWWVLYGGALSVSGYLDSGPLQGMFGRGWQAVAIAGFLGIMALSAWPLLVMSRRPAGAPARTG